MRPEDVVFRSKFAKLDKILTRMEPHALLRIGAWRVNPISGEISRKGQIVRLEVRVMRLLLCLAEHAGKVVSIDDLITNVWAGVNVSEDSVYQGVTSLRRVLGDDPKQPAYIETVPRLGYRMVAKVSPWTEVALPHSHAKVSLIPTVAIGLTLVVVLGLVLHSRITDKNKSALVSTQAQRSVAILPFLDLTEGMSQEEFADGMTEELIDKLSKVPGLRVPTATSSFFFRGKQVTVANVAKTLNVSYVLDGSVRKSGARVRVAARLVRAENGYVIWSETYDRLFNDLLMVQDDIAVEVTKALSASIGSTVPTR
jgi:transcriptional activator of cad operon